MPVPAAIWCAHAEQGSAHAGVAPPNTIAPSRIGAMTLAPAGDDPGPRQEKR